VAQASISPPASANGTARKAKTKAGKPAAAPGILSDGTVLRRLLGMMAPYRGYFFFALFLTLTLSVLGTVRPLLVSYAIDQAVVGEEHNMLLTWVWIIIGLLVVQTVLMYFSTYLTNWLAQTIMNNLRNRVFSHLLRQPLRLFDRTPIGTLQTRTISDIETLNDVFSQGFVEIVGDLLQLVLIAGFMFYQSWELTLVVFAILPFIFISTRIFQKKVKLAFQTVRKLVSDLNAFTQEHISGLLTTQIFNREKEEERRFDMLNTKHRDANLDAVLYYSVFFPVIEILSALALAVLVGWGARGVLDNTVSFGVLVSFLMYINMFFRPIRMLADQFNTLQYGMVSAERVFRLVDTDERPAPTTNPAPVQFNVSRPPAIEFKNVNFGYNPGELVLHDVSFRVEPGTSTALVGATGSGKSSIISLIQRFYEINTGEVLIDGTDIRRYDPEALRSRTGLVLQDVFLFSGTIHDNITLFNPDITREQVREAARRIDADKFIERLPGGYDFAVGERGASLSTGQRQLLNFLRVLVYNPAVLLLDEATANIDTETEELIQHAIQTVLQGRTSLVVAHRLSTIQAADQILVLSKGHIVERGTHQSLLAAEGVYKKLYLLQYEPKINAS